MPLASVSQPRSCLCCKARRVKCDRQQPCSNCVDFGQQCSFPQSPIRRRRPRKNTGLSPRDAAARVESPSPVLVESRSLVSARRGAPRVPSGEKGWLLVEGGQSLFLAENSWTNMKEEPDVSRTLLTATEDTAPWHSRIFKFSIEDVFEPPAAQPWSPTAAQLQLCWHLFAENVDPMVRILHMPTLHKMVLEAQTQPFELLDNGTKALLLVMCYAAMQSIGAAHCETLFAETASRMEQLCRIAAETAFTRARLIQTRHLQVLQAFTLFLTCSVHTGFSSVWTLVGLAMRIATSLGLHHDGTDFGLSPYEVEMRRRLWWELRLLDYRASEKCGIPASMVVDSTTRMPLNIYDSDFDQTTEAPLKEREEATEMSFSLLRFELSSQLPMLFQTVFNQTSADATGQRQPTGSQVEEKEGRLRELNNYLLRKYKCLFENDPRSPFFRFAAEASRILLTRIRLQIYFETAGRKRSSSPNEVEDSDERSELLGSDHSDELFLLSVTLLERHFRLLLDPETARWKWRVDTCTHWHAVAFVLSELRHRIDLLAKDGLQLPASPMLLPKNIQRAWDVIELIFSEQELGGGFTGTRRESWGPLEKLRQQIQTKLDLPNMPSPSSGLGFDLQPWPEFNLAMQQTDSMAPGAQSFSALDEDISFLWTCPIS